ncbi:hypothetical protein LTR62_006050 [Meristemomyces frigidus]|uniref:Heme haloperoxidase family profile domain-containing protein n=1 Tax=Meristemomyces frigidus TaxID=1508187 RepID=A0AAN7TCZ7_9PEZI|nr:hypothetical protein LTR62_006050 [Meristemomyces frigidus]
MSTATPPRIGLFVPPPPNASRSPCPVLNALSNHGYLERSGRKIYMHDLNAALNKVGMTTLLGSVFAVPTYFDYQDPSKAYLKKPVSLLARIWGLIKNPYTFFDYFGCWKRGQVVKGRRFINLVDLASHGAIEHDISLSRRDIAQPAGNNDAQQDLIDQLLDCSTDGGQSLSVDDLGRFIKARIHQQLKDNPELTYGPGEHQVNCGQVALMMHCFGDGKTIPVSYVRALFEDERLPEREGWSRRTWWPMGLIEFFGAVQTLKTAVGVQFG